MPKLTFEPFDVSGRRRHIQSPPPKMEKSNMEYSHKMESFSSTTFSFQNPLAKMENFNMETPVIWSVKSKKNCLFGIKKCFTPPQNGDSKFLRSHKVAKFSEKIGVFLSYS
jgi:hypothetical protein